MGSFQIVEIKLLPVWNISYKISDQFGHIINYEK